METSEMRILELDGLRGIAVLAVVMDHYLSWLPQTGSQYGWLGVDLFFILSGFLITSILLKLRDKEHYFGVFYKRRALRIFPPYFLGILVYFIVSLIAHKTGSVNLWTQYIFYYTSLYVGQPEESTTAVIMVVHLGLAVLWSLSVEELYYTFWAPVVRYTSRNGLIAVLVGMIVAAPLLRWWLHTPESGELYTFYCRMDALGYGSVLAMLIQDRRGRPAAWRSRERIFDWAAIVMPVVTIAVWAIYRGNRNQIQISTLGVVLADISLALITFTILRKSGSVAWGMRALRAPWLRSVGMVSYSLYLFHYPLARLVHPWVESLGLSRHASAIAQTLVSLIVSFAVAYGLWYAMESRILNWKDRNVPSPAHP
jgi:peptidoglycan/LPS O-acetylase OafA/YrhL